MMEKPQFATLPWSRQGDQIVDRHGYYVTQGSMHGKGKPESMQQALNYAVFTVNGYEQLEAENKRLRTIIDQLIPYAESHMDTEAGHGNEVHIIDSDINEAKHALTGES